MGIRPHKVAGYGVTNIKVLDKEVIDPRVDWERLRSGELWDATPQEFLSWMKKNRTKILELARATGEAVQFTSFDWVVELMEQRKLPEPAQCIHYHHEGGGLYNVLVLTPPDMTDTWERYDDTLDWMEETHRSKGKKSWVMRIRDAGIYPYNGYYIRSRKPKQSFLADPNQIPSDERTGHIYDELGPVLLTARAYGLLTDKTFGGPLAKGAFLRHLKRDFRPPVPYTILALILWSECFKDPVAFVNELKPLLYLYWG